MWCRLTQGSWSASIWAKSTNAFFLRKGLLNQLSLFRKRGNARAFKMACEEFYREVEKSNSHSSHARTNPQVSGLLLVIYPPNYFNFPFHAFDSTNHRHLRNQSAMISQFLSWTGLISFSDDTAFKKASPHEAVKAVSGSRIWVYLIC